MGGEDKQGNIDSTNIFEEFSQDEKLKSEVEENQKKKDKGTYYYLGILNNVFKTLNVALVLLSIVIGGYVYIQNNEDLRDVSYLDLICPIFVDTDLLPLGESCSSVSSLVEEYANLNSELGKEYYGKIANAVEDVYFVSNFAFSKEILFLLDKTKNRLSPLSVLKDFDRLKNEFEPINKGKILCENISLSGDGVFTIDCNAFSSRWDSNIVGPSGINQKNEKVSGTSISVASSFMNYLEKNSKEFVLIDKQKEFNFTDVVDYRGYSRKTNFKIALKLRSNNLSLK